MLADLLANHEGYRDSKVVNIGCNFITSVGGQRLIESCTPLEKLVRLDLSGNSLGHKVWTCHYHVRATPPLCTP